MKNVLLISIMLLFNLQIQAQQNINLSQKKEAISKLSILAGNWQGSGWMTTPDGQKHDFTQTEEISLKLNGVALLIQGMGREKESGKIIHDALAIITYNEATKNYSFRSHLSTGQSADANGQFEGESFVWGMEVPGGSVRYTLSITDGSKWHEKGEFSRDGTQWYQFIEMDLEKVSKN